MGQPYETSVAWQRADDLVVEVYKVTKVFPRSELYGLTSQMRRAAVSVAANIAEGTARQYMKELLRFLHLADSSLSEVAYYIHLASRLGFIDAETTRRLNERRSDAGRPLYGLIRWVKDEIDKGVVLNAKVAEDPELYTVGGQPGTGDRQPATGYE